VRARIDWKFALGLDLDDPGFRFSVLTEFRARLVVGQADHLLLDTMLDRFKERGLVKARGKQRTDSTHVLGAVRDLHLLELVGETLRATLDDLAAVVPDWLRTLAPSAWFERYGHRVKDSRLPRSREKREALALEIGADGFQLLNALDAPTAPPAVRTVTIVQTMRRVWQIHYARDEGQLRWRSVAELPPVADRLQSPYDPEMHYSMKRQFEWSGYKVHITETCDDDAAHLVTHVETCPAMQLDMTSTAGIHEHLAARELLPAEHFVDSAYINAGLLVGSRLDYGVALEGPIRGVASWQFHAGQGYDLSHFTIDWEGERVTCPQGLGILAHRPQYQRQPAHHRPVQPGGLRGLRRPGLVHRDQGGTPPRLLPSTRGVRRPQRGAGADARSRLEAALPRPGRGGRHALTRRPCLRYAPQPLHRAGKDRASAGLHRRRYECVADRKLA
jgi:transposase